MLCLQFEISLFEKNDEVQGGHAKIDERTWNFIQQNIMKRTIVPLCQTVVDLSIIAIPPHHFLLLGIASRNLAIKDFRRSRKCNPKAISRQSRLSNVAMIRATRGAHCVVILKHINHVIAEMGTNRSLSACLRVRVSAAKGSDTRGIRYL